MNRKILLTGFEPFGGDEKNPSWEAVRTVCTLDGTELYKLLLPVEWKKAVQTLFLAWDEFSPDAVLMTGLAGGSGVIRVERVALNLCGAIRDNAGLYPDGSSENAAETPVRIGAPAAYFATYNCRAILDALKSENIPAAYSYSAGTYICNHIMFSALDKAALENSAAKIGFIHVPETDGRRWGTPQTELSVIIRALELALNHISWGDR